ncbi:penicillin-binding protein activator [Chitinibacter tainanensis]|uniref:penicillin-binding protein activator n=1 Tax=Chitinibacter tainanensis TaxID=230667 RepID=UPI002355C40A|nr:penicillin-binding protein activator [Chitinibacter tainanensis]
MHFTTLLGGRLQWRHAFWATAGRTLAAGALLYGALAGSATAATESESASRPVNGYIALLLPGQAKAFKPAVDSIRAGVLAAERVHGGVEVPLVRVIDTTDKEEDIKAQYQRAVDGGAIAVIGPLTKSAINYLADSSELKVPTVALNGFDPTTLPQSQLYSFGLGVESDAAATAMLVRQEGGRQPVILQTNDSIGQRLAQGFSNAWREIHGSEPLVIRVANPRRDAPEIRQQLNDALPDAVFLAMDAKSARVVRPFVGNERAVYASNQINPGRLPATTLVDLAGVKYLDMPWLAAPDSEGYALYNRTRSSANDLERLFALGVDAWRIAAILSTGQRFERLEGLTGVLTLSPDNVVNRESVVRVMGRKPASASGTAEVAPEAAAPAVVNEQ